MKVFRVAALFVLLTGPAYAQMPNINLLADQPGKTEEQIEKEKAQQKAYQDTLKSIPDAKASNDPWGGVRSEAPKSASRTAAPKAKSKTKPAAKTVAKTGQQ
jgi:hypothetical protein